MPDGRILERGRSKAHRPLATDARAAAIRRGLEAFGRGEFYRAHEELEPAWMGTADPGERALLSGLIKVAAGGVHAARGNARGVRTNLTGARDRLQRGGERAPGIRVDLASLVAAIDRQLLACEALIAAPSAEGAAMPEGREGTDALVPDPPPHDVAGPPQPRRRPSLALPPLAIPWESA